MAKDVWILEIRDGESFYSVWETKEMAIEGAIQDYREHSDAMGIDKESVEEDLPGIRTALDEDEFFDDVGTFYIIHSCTYHEIIDGPHEQKDIQWEK